MKQNNKEQIVFDMSKRLQPKASLRLGMHTPMKKLTGAIRRQKRFQDYKRSFKDFYWLIFYINSSNEDKC